MTWLINLFLGLVQGLTEFLPVSSSAHLLVLGHIFALKDNFETYVFLNFGTLGALIYYSRQTLHQIWRQVCRRDYQLLLKLGVSLLPAGLLGFWGLSFFQGLENNLYLVVSMLLGVGLLMCFKPRRSKEKLELTNLPWSTVLMIGTLQALALLPGTSRVGITILAGLWLGLRQELAVRWSLLLAIPLTFGALGRVLLSEAGLTFLNHNFWPIIFGNLIAFGVGLVAIHWLVQILKHSSLRPFGVYRLGLGLILLTLLSLNVL